MQSFIKLIRTTIQGFLDDDCLSSGAAIAYYTIFSLPPLLIMVLSLTNAFGFSKEDVDQIIHHELGMPRTQINIGGGAGNPPNGNSKSGTLHFDLNALGVVSLVLGIGILVFSATAIFGELQYALNKIWRVTPDPRQGVVRSLLFKRLLSAGMLIVIWFALLVSLVLSAILKELLRLIWGETPGFIGQITAVTINELTTFLLAVCFFASIFKILPDARMRWHDVWVGALSTAVLFILGKVAIGWYLRSFEIGLSWGASAASAAAALVWVHYSSLIVLFGAELTEAWAAEFGQGSVPLAGAIKTTPDKPSHRTGIRLTGDRAAGISH